MANASVTQDTKGNSAILVRPRTMNHIETRRNFSALRVTHLAKDLAPRLALKVCLSTVPCF
jgi:hypothetical protein